MNFNDFSPSFTIILFLGWYACQAVAYYKFFEKAGEAGWKGAVPFLNYYIHLKLIGRPVWWLVLLFVPVVNFFIALTMHLDLLKSFGKSSYVDQSIGVILAPIYMVYVAFSGAEYLGKATELPKRKRTLGQEWFEAIVFAVFAATFIRWVFMEAYVIPTPSMEKSLLVGDFLFVSKINYGPRTPKTPLQLPLTHATIWGTDIPSYIEGVQLPQYRLPSLSQVERNDVVVFNYPVNDQYNRKSTGGYHPLDLKTHYIKRCVAIPGDVVEVKQAQVYINGEPGDNPELMQLKYQLTAKNALGQFEWEKVFEKYNLWQDGQFSGKYANVTTNSKVAAELKQLALLEDVSPMIAEAGDTEPAIFPQNPELFDWNVDNFGPLQIPARGWTVELTEENLAKYGSTIMNYEDLDDVQINEGKLLVDGQEVSSYTFTRDYYFMMGDNRHNSADSRYWGFVPEDYIVGEASFIWMSLDSHKSFPANIRWDRIFQSIN